MINKPVAWMSPDGKVSQTEGKLFHIPLYAAPNKRCELICKPSVCDCIELNDGGFPVKNATYWKRQYNLMSAQNDRLKSGIYHANEQIKYLESLAPQTKPLNDKEIEKEALKDKYWDWEDFDFMKFARAIEERHGIK